jgi:hypothetical protein
VTEPHPIEPNSAELKSAELRPAEPKPAEFKSAVRKRFLSLDTWAVVAAFVAAILIRVGVLKSVPW